MDWRLSFDVFLDSRRVLGGSINNDDYIDLIFVLMLLATLARLARSATTATAHRRGGQSTTNTRGRTLDRVGGARLYRLRTTTVSLARDLQGLLKENDSDVQLI